MSQLLLRPARIAALAHKQRLLNRSILSNSWPLVNGYSNASSDIARPLTKQKAKEGTHIIQATDYKYDEGQIYEGFQCQRRESVPEFGIASYIFRHIKTGTELWHLDRKDTNNVFSINFRTTPFDSTGLPHILEHSVLCGSEKFPVRDPFFKMLTRSVATFMNAMTGPDYTLYPFSSMNEIDYRNLQRIYLDAVFRPNLAYLDFLQEGWRLEHANPHDKTSEFVLKGVVYNEMKGAFSENSSVFSQNLLNNLLPSHTYGYVSGGNPLEIPKLTHANLVDFHKKYYHPSNSKIYAYGTFELQKTLAYVNNEYLSQFEPVDRTFSNIPNQKRWSEPRQVHISSRFDSMGAPFDRQNQIGVALLMSDISEVQETFVLQVLSELLVRGPNSPFYRNLIEPNFSGGYNHCTGYDAQVKDTFFSVGLQDLRVEDFDRVLQIFDKTIVEVVEKGFEETHIESVLHNIELSLKHQSPQFGLGLLFNSSPLWNHDGNVVENLRVSKMVSSFRENLKNNPKFLQQKVEQYFANNKHKLTLTMSPDDLYESNFKAAELDLLKQKIISLDDEKREEVYQNGLKLEEAQKAIPNLDVLPCLSLHDVKEAAKMQPINVVKIRDTPTQVCHVQTNEVSYFKCYFDGSALNKDEVMLIPLFCDVVSDMGTEKHDFREFDKAVLSKTAGIDFKLHCAENIFDSKSYNLGVLMRTHALDKNTAGMFELSQELLASFKIADSERLKMLIENYMSNLAQGITSSGHLYAMQSCAGLVTDAAKLKSQLAGLEHIDFMKEYIKTHDTESILRSLERLGKKLFNKNSMRVAFNTSDEFYPQLMQDYDKFLAQLPAAEPAPKLNNAVNLLEPAHHHFVMNIPVNYCSKAFFSVPYTHRDHPALRVLAKLVSAKYLLPVVREQNGAYGAGAKMGSDGIFSFYSYRDPNSTKTLEAFDNTYTFLQQHQAELLTEQTLFEAKLGVLQQLDAPVAPGNLGIDFFLYGVTQEMFLKYRARMLAVTLAELQAVIEKYFKQPPKHYGKCILGPENAKLEEETQLKWNVIK